MKKKYEVKRNYDFIFTCGACRANLRGWFGKTRTAGGRELINRVLEKPHQCLTPDNWALGDWEMQERGTMHPLEAAVKVAADAANANQIVWITPVEEDHRKLLVQCEVINDDS